jgi:hypothetical protein
MKMACFEHERFACSKKTKIARFDQRKPEASRGSPTVFAALQKANLTHLIGVKDVNVVLAVRYHDCGLLLAK